MNACTDAGGSGKRVRIATALCQYAVGDVVAMTRLPSRLLIGQHQASLPERLLVRERHAVRREPSVAGREAAGLLGVGTGRAGDHGIQLMAVRRPATLQQVFATSVCKAIDSR